MKIIRDSLVNRDGHIIYKRYQEVRYVVDVAVIAKSEKELKEVMVSLVEEARRMGLQLNAKEFNALRISVVSMGEAKMQLDTCLLKIEIDGVEDVFHLRVSATLKT